MAPKRENSPPLPGDGLFGGYYSDARRAKLVRSDGSRKRLAHQWTNRHMPVPPRVRYQAVPIFDRIRREREEELRRRARQRNGGEGSSRGGSSSTAPPALPPPEGYDAQHFGISLGPEDFVPDEQMDAVMAAALLRSEVYAQEKAAAAKLNAEINQHLLETALVISTLPPTIDLVTDSDEE